MSEDRTYIHDFDNDDEWMGMGECWNPTFEDDKDIDAINYLLRNGQVSVSMQKLCSKSLTFLSFVEFKFFCDEKN